MRPDHLAMVFETFTKEAALTFGQALQARRDLLLEELSTLGAATAPNHSPQLTFPAFWVIFFPI